MPARKKIAVILSRFPFPLDKGDKLRAYHQIGYLARFHDVYLYTLCEEKPTQVHVDALLPLCKEMHTYILNRAEILRQTSLAYIKKIPIQVGYFYSSSIHKKIHSSLLSLQPDSVYCQLSRTALYGKDLPFRKIIDFQDAFSTNYERIQQNFTGIKKYFYARESRCMRDFEIKMTDWFDACTIISQFDKDNIQITPNRIVVVSNGVDTAHFQSTQHVKKYDILFSGHLGYVPNKNAVQFLVEKIAPLLLKRDPSIQIAIVGSSGNELKKYETANIHIHGWVEDIRDAYNAARIFVAPLFTGAGLQNKLLEAMSMGLPCITTSVTNASLLANENKDVLIANNEVEFVEKIIYLLKNKSLQEEFAINGRKFVQENFSWDNANEKLLRLF